MQMKCVIIESRRWQRDDGKTAIINCARPWTNESGQSSMEHRHRSLFGLQPFDRNGRHWSQTVADTRGSTSMD
jgi:hypothetical protein